MKRVGLIIALVSVLFIGALKTAPAISLGDYVRDRQLYFVEKSYSVAEGDLFTVTDLEIFKKNLNEVKKNILGDESFYRTVKEIKRLSEKKRDAEFLKVLNIYSKSWAEVGEISSRGQTDAGQQAERLLAELIVDEVKKQLASISITPFTRKSMRNLVWNDEFDGTKGTAPNPEKWGYNIGGDGWGNAEVQVYTDDRSNSYIENGNLMIRTMKERSGRITSARLITKGKAAWSSGKIEVRAKIPKGQGLWPAIWLWPENDEGNGIFSNSEIDIMEALGKDTKEVFGSAHFYRNEVLNSHPNFLSLEKTDYSKTFHLYGVEWDEKWIRWSVDRQTRAAFRLEKLFKDEKFQPYNQKFFLILNLAVGGVWPGNPDRTTPFPSTMKVDYVRVYQ